MRAIHLFLLSRSRSERALLALLIGALIAAVDFVTGRQLSLFGFFLLPVGLCAWYLGERQGHVAAVLSAITGALVNQLSGPEQAWWLLAWNWALRLVTFSIVAMLLARLRSTLGRLEAALARERELSRVDALTGVHNAQGFRDVAGLELSRAGRYRRHVSVVFLDLDNFKEVNDTYGHAVGDEVLRLVATQLVSSLRRSDTIARMGGDEFAILLPETDRAATETLLRKLRERLTRELAERGWPVTVSFGAAITIPDGVGLEWLINQADRLMYSVKSSGKDGIAVAEVTAPSLP